MSSYGANRDDTLLRDSFPFAAFNNGWQVLPCRQQSLEPRLLRPVINIMHGVDVHYYSLEIMVDTEIEWVSHPKYDLVDFEPDEELRIWRKHNPGIFRTTL